ncbi:MAG: radical SAM family heme chaperone HemW [Clostridia bacterium]|nr:radical SAM family heme chaperone HemW [Clostridia bacterium]
MRGIYVHIPFCRGKCPYCGFYSVRGTPELMDAYRDALIRETDSYSGSGISADTVYFGGGTPSVFGGRTAEVLRRIKDVFCISEDAEVTMECNPSSCTEEVVASAVSAGVNRISLGLQSAVDGERRALGRTAGADGAVAAVGLCRKYGVKNLSLDLMIGIPGQTRESLRSSLDLCARLGAEHISVYMLQIEEGTFFYKNRDRLSLPDEELCEKLYFDVCSTLASRGYGHYEISNFALPGYESRHNTKYWNCDEYLGFGASAHSFMNGRRYYYSESVGDYIAGKEPVPDGDGGGVEEYLMLRLRLAEGVRYGEFERRFGCPLPRAYKKAAGNIGGGLVKMDENGFSLTEKGFMVSNAVIGKILFPGQTED